MWLTYPFGCPPPDQYSIVDAFEATHAKAADQNDNVGGSHASQDDIDTRTLAFPQAGSAHHQQANHVGQQSNAEYHGDQDTMDDELIPDLLDKAAAVVQSCCRSASVGGNLR